MTLRSSSSSRQCCNLQFRSGEQREEEVSEGENEGEGKRERKRMVEISDGRGGIDDDKKRREKGLRDVVCTAEGNGL